MSLENWNIANSQLIAKSLAELLYEEILVATEDQGIFSVTLKSGIRYEFKATRGSWNFLQIESGSLKRIPHLEPLEAGVFFQDANADLEMSEITLAHFTEEMNNTLFSEMKVLENRRSISTSELARLSGEELQPYLSGHPKILLNKGRIGFSANDLKKYAPEYSGEFQLMWIAIKKNALIEASSVKMNDYFKQQIPNNLNISLENYSLMPVHPWQYSRFIEVQYQKEIAQGTIVPLTEMGPFYRPQISIRTLSNVSNPKDFDLKLSLTILNTSAYRGIASDCISIGPELSDYMEDLCHKDSLLKEAGTNVLKEVYAASFIHPTYGLMKDAPYRYKELLGCVVRESASSKLADNEKAIMTGSLFYIGDDGQSLIGEYIKRSGVSAEEWILSYFSHIVIPLYHLQLTQGIGVVSHGQNIVLRLTNFKPSGMFIKDFQGDLRINQDLISNFPENLKKLKALPGNYLIHDLITGHFITVLRFISPILENQKLLNEKRFYSLLGQQIGTYLREYHPDLKINDPMNLLRPEFEKVILNKVRFKIGYEDSSVRPLPLLGTNLINPLFVASKDIL